MKMCVYYIKVMYRDFSRDELEPAAAVYLILYSPGCCCLTSWIWRDIIGLLISDTLLSCKWCSGPLFCMTPTQDISSRLVSERLPASGPNQSSLLFNWLLAVGELHCFWKVFIGVWRKNFIWQISSTPVCCRCVGDSGDYGKWSGCAHNGRGNEG